MATSTLSNHFKFQMLSGNMDFSANVYKVILMGSAFAFDIDVHATLADTQFDTWILSTGYILDDVVVPTVPNGHKYICTTAGTSHTSEPTWPTTPSGTVGDGTVVWTEDGEDNQLPTGGGYTQNDKVLANVSVAEDDVNDRGRVTWDDVQWDASGDTIGPTGSALLYDDTSADKTIVGCMDFIIDYTVTDGNSLQLQNIALNSN